jgi:HEAT repeat protein
MNFDTRHILRLAACLLTLAAMAMAPTPARALSAKAPAAEPVQDATRQGIPTMDQLADQLAATDPTVRRAAALRLGDTGPEALAGLKRALTSNLPARRRGAALGIGLMPVPALAADDLLAALADPDVGVRSMAAHASAMAGPLLAPRLVALLTAEDTRQRDAAGYALTLMGPNAVPALVHGLNTDDPFARSKAAWLLGQMGAPARAAIPALIRALDAPDPRVTHVVAEAIDLIGPDPALVWQHLLLLGGGPTVFPLPRLGSRAAPILVRLLTRPGTPLAQTAFHALAAIGLDAIPALHRAVAAGTPSQRTAAALLLSDIDPKSVLALPDDLRLSLSGARHDQ